MSVTADYYLADWARLEHALKEAGSEKEYLQRYRETDQPWLVLQEMPSEHEHWNAATVAYYVHEAIAHELKPPTRSKLETLLRTFGIIEGESAHDLGIHPEFFVVTLSPATVDNVLTASLGLDWDEIRATYLQHYTPNPEWWLPSVDEFIAYLVGFIEFLESAKRQSRGVVVRIG